MPNSGISLPIESGGTLTETGSPITQYGILLKTNATFNIYGTLDVYSLDLKNGVVPKTIYSTGEVIVYQLVDHTGNVSEPFTVDGSLIVNPGTLDNDGTIEGDGTVTASTYSGTGSLFGISPTNSIAGGSTLAGYTWTGGASVLWQTGSNWSQGSAPSDVAHDVIIQSGGTFNPTISTTPNNCHNLTIESEAILTISETGVLDVSGTLTHPASSVHA